MKSKGTNFVFITLTIVAWVIFVGLSIEAGGLLVNFICNMFYPDIVPKLYQTLDLREMFVRDNWIFFVIFSFILTIAILKAYLFYLVVILVQKLNISRPFNRFAADQISKISYFTFTIGMFSVIARPMITEFNRNRYDLNNLDQFWVDGQAFILMSAVIYIIAIIFDKGLAIQEENDLTV